MNSKLNETEENAIYTCFMKRVSLDPEHLVVMDEQRKLSRLELDRLADTIATMLPENAQRVGIVMDHSVEMIASIFAVLKIGAAYIPVEPNFPEGRIHFMMNDCGVDCIITHKRYASRLTSFRLALVENGLEINEADVPVAVKAKPGFAGLRSLHIRLNRQAQRCCGGKPKCLPLCACFPERVSYF